MRDSSAPPPPMDKQVDRYAPEHTKPNNKEKKRRRDARNEDDVALAEFQAIAEQEEQAIAQAESALVLAQVATNVPCPEDERHQFELLPWQAVGEVICEICGAEGRDTLALVGCAQCRILALCLACVTTYDG